jgi:uncharacterized membrane protein HdeD (DUF308 family)
MLLSGVLDIVLASIVIFDLPAFSPWAIGLLIGINMAAGGVALVGMSLHGAFVNPGEISGAEVPR